MKANLFMRGQNKGEITSQQIVMMIVLIASFAILLFFLFRLNLGEETDKELCRNSVLLKGKSVFKDSTLLNCKKSYVCLTADGNCDSSKLLSLELKKVKTKNDTYQVIADEMRDCWWMFGEGKVNYVGDDLTRNNYCSICSQLVFDDSIGKIFNGDSIDREDFYKFLGETKIPGGEKSYLGYLYGVEDINFIKETLESQGTRWGTINLRNKGGYLVTTAITSKVGQLDWIVKVAIGGAAVGAIVLGTIAAIPTGGISLGIVIAVVTSTVTGGIAGGALGAGAGGFAGIVVKGASGEEDFLAPTIISLDEFDALKCEEVITLS